MQSVQRRGTTGFPVHVRALIRGLIFLCYKNPRRQHGHLGRDLSRRVAIWRRKWRWSPGYAVLSLRVAPRGAHLVCTRGMCSGRPTALNGRELPEGRNGIAPEPENCRPRSIASHDNETHASFGLQSIPSQVPARFPWLAGRSSQGEGNHCYNGTQLLKPRRMPIEAPKPAPAYAPRMSGEAIALRNNPWKVSPETGNTPPIGRTASTRGNRTSKSTTSARHLDFKRQRGVYRPSESLHAVRPAPAMLPPRRARLPGPSSSRACIRKHLQTRHPAL